MLYSKNNCSKMTIMDTKISLLFSLAIYYMKLSFVKANEANFKLSTLNPCLGEGTNGWSDNWSSLIYCASLCIQNGTCTGITYNKAQETCRVCTLYGIPGQSSHSGADLFRKTKGNQYNKYLVKEIPDSSLSASSELTPLDGYHAAFRARLTSTSAWTAAEDDTNIYIQARFNTPKEVKGIVTKGRHNFQLQCVTTYRASYSMDCVSFAYVTNANNLTKVFPGNSDSDTSVVNMLEESFLALCVRLHPKDWVSFTSMRFDIIGCDL